MSCRCFSKQQYGYEYGIAIFTEECGNGDFCFVIIEALQSVRRELSIRHDEINNLLQFLNFMENSFEMEEKPEQKPEEKFDSTTVMTSIKAGIVLMLYNAVESTITKCLEKLHEELGSQKLKFDDCNEKIKQLIVMYYENAKLKSSDVQKKVPYILEQYGYMTGKNVFHISYKELSKFYSLYSGNLDSREIVAVLGKYGIELNERASELKTIKEDRNKLAHGELSFEEVGRNLSVPQLIKMEKTTFGYMEKVIGAVEEYMGGKMFLAADFKE